MTDLMDNIAYGFLLLVIFCFALLFANDGQGGAEEWVNQDEDPDERD